MRLNFDADDYLLDHFHRFSGASPTSPDCRAAYNQGLPNKARNSKVSVTGKEKRVSNGTQSGLTFGFAAANEVSSVSGQPESACLY